MARSEFTVSGMTCGHCETAVRSAVSEIAGVRSVDVSAQSGTLAVESAGELDVAAVRAAVEDAGYSLA